MQTDATDQADRGSARRRWAGLLIISLGVAMIIVDSTIVNVTIPQIIKDLGITSTDAQWVQDVYTLVFAALLLVAGWRSSSACSCSCRNRAAARPSAATTSPGRCSPRSAWPASCSR
ncbi:MAG: MFS transporter [Streptosporangiaceae bacterium]|jgi:MFS family permease